MCALLIPVLSAALLAPALLCFQAFGRYLYTYEISDVGIVLRLCGVARMNLMSFDDIGGMKRLFLRETLLLPGMFRTLRLGNRVWGEVVKIDKRSGFMRTLLITPDDAEGFVSSVSRRLHERTNGASLQTDEPS